MIDRFYRKLVAGKLERYPAVSLLGPRQCGKTTLAKSFGGQYFDMESEGAALRFDAEWDRLMRGEDLVIIDEAQCAPEIFPRLRGASIASATEGFSCWGRFLPPSCKMFRSRLPDAWGLFPWGLSPTPR